MGEKSLIGNAAKSVTLATIGVEALGVVYELRFLILLTFALVLVDLHFGNAEARKNGEKIRLSRMLRRTANKMVDYFCIIVVAALLGMAFQQAYGWECIATATTALLICWICEINSIYGHYCYLHNVKKRFDVVRLIVGIFKRKAAEVGDVLEEAELDNTNEKENGTDKELHIGGDDAVRNCEASQS